MTKFLLFLSISITFLHGGITVDKNIEQFKLYDQFDQPHNISSKTKKIIFAFSKDVGHNVNDFLEKEDKNYLSRHNTQFVIDLSAAPGMIRSLFIIPKLEKYTYPVLIIENEETANRYADETNKGKIMVVSLDNLKVTAIDFFRDTNELKSFLEK